jgi:hypothetical protein
MTDYSKVFVDTAPFIYFIEKDSNNPQYHEKVKSFFRKGYENDKQLRQFKEIKCITVDELL